MCSPEIKTKCTHTLQRKALHDLEQERIETFLMGCDRAHNKEIPVQSESILFCILKNEFCLNLF